MVKHKMYNDKEQVLKYCHSVTSVTSVTQKKTSDNSDNGDKVTANINIDIKKILHRFENEKKYERCKDEV